MPRLSVTRAAATGFALLTSAATLLLAAPAASAADLPAPTVSTVTVKAGAYVTVSGTGCVDPDAGTDYPGVIIKGSHPTIGDGGQAKADGSWAIQVLIAGEVPTGLQTIQATCDIYNHNVAYPKVTITVVDPTATAPPAPVAAPGCADCAKLASGKVDAGDKVTLSYAGFQPGERVTIVMRSTPVTLGTFTADANGVVTATVTVPAGAARGSHTLTFTGPLTGDRVLGFTIPQAGRSLASTGADVGLPLALGTGLVLVGGAVLLVARRRTAGATQS